MWLTFALSLLVPLCIIMIVIYFRTQKLFSLSFSLSALTYLIAMFYTIDAFELERDYIFLALVVSATLMAFVGFYFRHSKNGKTKRK